MKLKLSVLVALFFVLPFQGKAQSQQNDSEIPAKNASLVIAEIKTMLQNSEVMLSLREPFQLSTNFPDLYVTDLYQALLNQGKKVKLEPTFPRVQLRLFPENSIRQTDKTKLDRVLTGELHILLTDENSILNQTEILSFRYADTILADQLTLIDSDWQGAAFQVRDLKSERDLWKKVGQPAILAVATGVTVFLLFNIRAN